MRAERRVEAVDVEADVDELRQLRDDPAALRCPGLAGEARFRQLRVVEGDDAAAGGSDALVLVLAQVADADLDQPLDARLADDVVHDRGMRVLESLVRVPQIRVRVEVQDAQSGILRGVRRDGAE